MPPVFATKFWQTSREFSIFIMPNLSAVPLRVNVALSPKTTSAASRNTSVRVKPSVAGGNGVSLANVTVSPPVTSTVPVQALLNFRLPGKSPGPEMTSLPVPPLRSVPFIALVTARTE